MADPQDARRGVQAQESFRNAGNANVVQQAGKGLSAASASKPVPGDRLSTPEVEAEAGRRPDEGDPAAPNGTELQADTQAKMEEREAIRRQGPKETDTDLDQGSRPEGSLAAEDPVITSNPD